MRGEVLAIRRACESLGKEYKPPITFVVVQKRHHTRFFQSENGDPNDYDRNGNVKAGTIVDIHITHPTYIEFYLVSYASIQVFITIYSLNKIKYKTFPPPLTLTFHNCIFRIILKY